MSELSGPHHRVIDVLNFHAAHPTEAFTLSELAERLGLSLGSAHRVLATLVDARYLSRHPKHKTYSLGVALLAIGHAALEKHPSVHIARRELARLTDELKVQCTAAAVVDDELLLLAKDGTPQTHEGMNRVGERRPFIPPFGISHVAWAGEEVIAAYLAKAPPALDEPRRAYLETAVATVRRRGYAIAANGPGLSALRQVTLLPIDQPRDDAYRSKVHGLIARLTETEMQLLDLADAKSVGVSFISVPVFAPTGAVALELTVSGMPHDLEPAEIERHAERLRAAAAVVTGESHGRMPG